MNAFHRHVFLLLLLLGTCLTQPAMSAEPARWAADNLASLRTLYRELHQHPELSFHEVKTAKRLSEELSALGAKVTEKIGGHGVVGIIHNGNGPTLMLRTDLDGLPVVEQTRLDGV